MSPTYFSLAIEHVLCLLYILFLIKFDGFLVHHTHGLNRLIPLLLVNKLSNFSIIYFLAKSSRPGSFTLASHRTVRDTLMSYGSYYPAFGDIPTFQCANKVLFSSDIFLNNSLALFDFPLYFLYFLIIQHVR